MLRAPATPAPLLHRRQPTVRYKLTDTPSEVPDRDQAPKTGPEPHREPATDHDQEHDTDQDQDQDRKEVGGLGLL